AVVADVDRIALAALDGSAGVIAADGVHNDHLRVIHAQAVARELVALEVEIQEVAAAHALGEYVARSGDGGQHAFDLFPEALDHGEIRAVDLDPDRCAHAR